MLKYADKENEDGMFIADIVKAFHSVEYYLIFATLEKTQQWQSVHSVGQNHAKWGKKLSLKKVFLFYSKERNEARRSLVCIPVQRCCNDKQYKVLVFKNK